MPKKLVNITSVIFLILFFACSDKQSTPPTPPPLGNGAITARLLIDSMGTGFNLGNTFDYSLNNTNPESIKPIIDLYYNAGMRHVRVPVTWMDGFSGNTLADANGNLNLSHPRFIQLKAVIDYALGKNMYVVLNTHHERWLYQSYTGQGKSDSAFQRLWLNIATHFRDYPYRLVFEVLNEPQGVFGDWSGGANPGNSAALDLTRRINLKGYSTIRGTGGKNLDRVIMVSVNGMGNHTQLDDVYPTAASLPGSGSDKYLAAQVHTYDPWSFCGETGSNAAWPGSTAISSSLRTVASHARLLDIPINYGEFGVGRSGSQAERNTPIVREYYRTMRLTALSEKMSVTPWDDRGWFGLTNSSGTTPVFLHDIVPSMMAK